MDLSYCSPFLDKSLGPSVRGKCDPRHMNCVIIVVQLIVLPAGGHRLFKVPKARGVTREKLFIAMWTNLALFHTTFQFLISLSYSRRINYDPIRIVVAFKLVPLLQTEPSETMPHVAWITKSSTDTDSLSVENQHQFSVRLKLVLRLKIPYPVQNAKRRHIPSGVSPPGFD